MLHIGALLDRAPGRKYVGSLRFAELALRNPLPRTNTLSSMRKALPAELVIALRAPRHAVVSARGPLRDSPELTAGLAWLTEAADALQARAVIFSTPSELTPGARSRDLLRAYVEKLPRVPERHYVWAAQGAWEPEEAQALCRELGILRAFDPLETAASPGDAVYATLRAMGHRAGFTYASLADAVSRTLVHAPKEAFLSVDAERSFEIAKRLKGLAAESLGEQLPAGIAADGGDELEEDDEPVDDEVGGDNEQGEDDEP
jgi:uncharacterized protein YecE (DUF72 family)